MLTLDALDAAQTPGAGRRRRGLARAQAPRSGCCPEGTGGGVGLRRGLGFQKVPKSGDGWHRGCRMLPGTHQARGEGRGHTAGRCGTPITRLWVVGSGAASSLVVEI